MNINKGSESEGYCDKRNWERLYYERIDIFCSILI